jgi:filamentous hemagglutinin family protein
MLRKKRSFAYLLATCIIASTSGAYAQNITTGANGLNTNVEQVGNQYNITGGTQAEANLFYSLQKLGLSTGEIANFLSNPSVQNVLTRVTGGEASLINGLLQVTGGNSNLFIMNPAGIVFGANASLNVPASFAATTATGIKVGNGWFGINSSVDEVRNLTGNVTGYGFTNTLPSIDPNPSGVILNEGNLSVSAGKSVTLVGGMVVNTGTIATPSGNITIAATTNNKFIKITSEGSVLSFELPIADRQVIGNAPVLKGVDLPNLLTGKTTGTAIASGTLNADALANGNGGNVNVLAENTKFDGLITARGGTESGNGGFAEVSARQKLSYSGLVDLRAPNGFTGNLLIDPATFVIATAGGDITPLTVANQWNLANTIYAATTSLTVTDAVTANSANTLTLDAPTINLNAAITNTGAGALLGTTATVNVGTAGTVQNGVDVAASGATVNLATANYALTKTVAINKNLTLNGAGAANTTISGGNSVGILNIGSINPNITVNINNLAIANGSTTTSFGGGILNFGITTINNSNFASNKADFGGAIANLNNGVLTIANSTFSQNLAKFGGAILNNNTATVSNSTFTQNVATTENGGGFNNNGTATISDSSFSNNSAKKDGGAVYNNGKATINNSSFSANSATVNGGAISNFDTVTVSNSTFSANVATKNGGAILNNSIATISNSTFSANVATKNGGAINNNLQVTISNSTFSGNNAQFGGAILNKDTATISNSKFSANVASENGGAVNSNGTATIANSTFSNNAATKDGGAVYNNNVVTIANSIFSKNSAQINGGAILNAVKATISNSTFSENSAMSNGGAINNNGVVAIANSTFAANSATLEGGAIGNKSEITVSNSTFSGNSATNGGAIDSDGMGKILNSTFYGNRAVFGGAIEISNTVPPVSEITIANSIIVGNTATTAGNEIFKQNADIITFKGANIVGTNGASGISGAFIGTTPITPSGAANTVINTTLANNGGSTQTFALIPSSIAINGSGELATTFDQRGFFAIGIRDIGAFEFGHLVTPPVTSPVTPPITLKPDIDPNKETHRDDEKKVLGLSSLTLIAFLSTDDIEFQRLDRFLLVIVELMNNDGGDLEIDTKDIWKDANISIFDQSVNQDVIKVAIRRSIGRFIGNEYIDLVDINFETKEDKKTILLKVRKAPKLAKFLKS